jgi:hypothetical protein
LPPRSPVNIKFLAAVRRLGGGYLAPSFFFARDTFELQNKASGGLAMGLDRIYILGMSS